MPSSVRVLIMMLILTWKTCAVGPDKQAGPRSGFFHNFSKKEVIVKKWDAQLEDVKVEHTSEEELARFRENKREMDRFLAPYPYDSYKKWISLTNHLTPSVIEKLQPACGFVCSMAQFVSEPSTSQSRKRDAEEKAMNQKLMEASSKCKTRKVSDEEGLPQMKIVKGTKITYSKVPHQKYPEGATPSEITKFSIDSSYQLELVLEKYYSEDPLGILGEIQFAFICFLIAQNYDSFEHWKVLVHLLCSSDEALRLRPHLFTEFIGILHFQVREIPSDFFVDIVSNNNFLTVTLQEFFSNLEAEDIDAKLKSKGLKFRQHLTQKFKWDFTSEPDDYAPVVVESTD